MSIFYNNFVRLCSDRGISPTKAGNDIGVTSAAVSGWKSGAVPRDATIAKLAKYFGCDISELKNEKTATFNGDGDEINIEVKRLTGNREELKKLVDRLTDEEVQHYLSDFRKTILGE